MKLKVFSVVWPPGRQLEPQTQVVRKLLARWGYDHHQQVVRDRGGMTTKLLEYFKLVRDLDASYTHVMLVDARDVVVLAEPRQVMEVWQEFNHPWVFNAEPHIWPPSVSTPEDYPGPQVHYRYLNSGVSIGEREHILEWYSRWTDGFTTVPKNMGWSSQAWLARHYFEHYHDLLLLDYNCALYQTMCGSQPRTVRTPGKCHNTTTGTDPLIIHYNGGANICDSKWRGIWEDLL